MSERPVPSEEEISEGQARIEPATFFIPYLAEFYQPKVFTGIEAYVGEPGVDQAVAASIGRELEHPLVKQKEDVFFRRKDKKRYQELVLALKKDEPGYFAHYFAQHQSHYLERIDRLVASAEEPVIKDETRAVIAIAAMNETGLKQVVEAVRKSYGESFTQEIPVVIYHNFKDEPEEEVKKAVEEVRSYPNVCVVEEQVPHYSDTGTAKKVVSDLALRAMARSRRVPLVMMDADVVEVTPLIIQDAIVALEESKNLAVSAHLAFDQEAKVRFPVLGYIWDLEEQAAFSKDTKKSKKVAIGSFTVIHPATLAAVGGLVPSPLPREDMRLSDHLVGIVQGWRSSQRYPIEGLEEKRHLVRIDPSRQIFNLLQGRGMYGHWEEDAEYASQVEGTRRFDWRKLKPEEVAHIPELRDSLS